MASFKSTEPKNITDLPELSSGKIHVWKASTNLNAINSEIYINALRAEEKSRAGFFKSPKAADAYIASQGALRMLLSAYLNIEPDKVNIGRQKKGKPFSKDDPSLFFNISNSGGQIVLAFTRDGEMGIDIERIRELPDLDELIMKNFTTSEIEFISAKPNKRLKRFFRFWTVKEAYLKAIGEGMRLKPENVEFFMNNEYIRLLSVKGVPEMMDWYFSEFEFLSDYVGTITYSNANTEIDYLELNL